MSLAYAKLALPEPRFVENPFQVQVSTVARTWRTRLLTWPWHPWVRTMTRTVPDPTLFFDASTFTYYGHPATIAELKRRCERAVHTQN